jgi:hypothetical protein
VRPRRWGIRTALLSVRTDRRCRDRLWRSFRTGARCEWSLRTHQLARSFVSRVARSRAALFDPRSTQASRTKDPKKRPQRRVGVRLLLANRPSAAAQPLSSPPLGPTAHRGIHSDTIMVHQPTGALNMRSRPCRIDRLGKPVNSSPVRPDKDRALSPPRFGCRGPASGSKRSCA